MARLPLVVLAVLMVVGVHASPPTIQDYLMDSSIQTGGKPTSYNSGYGVNKLCLAEVQLDQCGFYSGSTSLFQTNYDCCGSEAPLGAIPGLSIGSCVWESNFNPGTGPYPLSPTLSRFGKIFATCQLNSGIDKCGGPDCAKLKLSLQGDIYWTIARSHEDTFVHTLGAGGVSGDVSDGKDPCCDLALDVGFTVDLGGCPGPCEEVTAGDCDSACLDCCGCFPTKSDNTKLQELPAECESCCSECGKKSNTTAPADPQRGLKKWLSAHKNRGSASNKKTSATRHHTANGDDVYIGQAYIAIGTAVIVDDHSGHTRVEPVGTFTAVLDWDADSYINVEYTESELHWIRPGTFELMWREEEPAGYKAT